MKKKKRKGVFSGLIQQIFQKHASTKLSLETSKQLPADGSKTFNDFTILNGSIFSQREQAISSLALEEGNALLSGLTRDRKILDETKGLTLHAQWPVGCEVILQSLANEPDLPVFTTTLGQQNVQATLVIGQIEDLAEKDKESNTEKTKMLIASFLMMSSMVVRRVPDVLSLTAAVEEIMAARPAVLTTVFLENLSLEHLKSLGPAAKQSLSVAAAMLDALTIDETKEFVWFGI